MNRRTPELGSSLAGWLDQCASIRVDGGTVTATWEGKSGKLLAALLKAVKDQNAAARLAAKKGVRP